MSAAPPAHLPDGRVNRLGIEMLTFLGMNPVDQVGIAAELGCAGVSVGIAALDLKAFGYPPLGLYDPWSLAADVDLRRRLKAALTDTGVRIQLGEGFLVLPGHDVTTRAADLDIMADLNATRINAISIDPDMGRTYDQLAKLAEMVTDRDMDFLVEFAPKNAIDTLPKALAAVEHVGTDRCGVMFDVMHLIRSGGSLDDIRALPPGRLRYAQLCDVPLQSPGIPYKEEAIFQRLAPGDGELPLRAMLDVLPADLHVGVEVPDLAALRAGVSPRDHAARAVAAARALGF